MSEDQARYMAQGQAAQAIDEINGIMDCLSDTVTIPRETLRHLMTEHEVARAALAIEREKVARLAAAAQQAAFVLDHITYISNDDAESAAAALRAALGQTPE